jgi:ribosomal protein S18 acetylase RimI-like enzyme
MDFLIRKMISKDIDAVYDLGFSQKEFSSDNGSFWTKEQLKNWVGSSNDLLLVAEKDKQIIGFSLYAVHLPTGKVTWENLYVSPADRKLGVASALAKEGLRQIKALGYTYIMLGVMAEDQESFTLLMEKFGFKRGSKVLWMDQLL